MLCRTCFGVRGSAIVGLLRGLVACLGYAIFVWTGGELLFVMFRSWNVGLDRINSNAAMTSQGINAPHVSFSLSSTLPSISSFLY
jgi:cytosine/uracil/thiamine/allantoin permease